MNGRDADRCLRIGPPSPEVMCAKHAAESNPATQEGHVTVVEQPIVGSAGPGARLAPGWSCGSRRWSGTAQRLSLAQLSKMVA